MNGNKTGGRTKGTPNKVTADLRAAILGALEAKGGQAYLERIADEDPRTFCALLAKVLPMTLQAPEDGPKQLIFTWLAPGDDDTAGNNDREAPCVA